MGRAERSGAAHSAAQSRARRCGAAGKKKVSASAAWREARELLYAHSSGS